MPLKDIDWGKVAKQTQVSYNIGRTNAIINAETEGNVPKYEWLTGRKLVERDPIAEAIKFEKKSREQQPIISKLKEISEKTITPQAMTTIMQNTQAIDYNRLAEAFPLAITKKSDQFDYNMNEKIDKTILDKYKYKMPYDIIKEIPFDEEKLADLRKLQKEVARQSSNLGLKSYRYPELISEKDTLMEYNEVLKDILKKHGSIKRRASPSTSTSTSTGKGVKNRIYYTNPKELVQRLNVLLGQVQAGNNSKHIKNEIADISHHLYRKKEIKKKEYKNILDHFGPF